MQRTRKGPANESTIAGLLVTTLWLSWCDWVAFRSADPQDGTWDLWTLRIRHPVWIATNIDRHSSRRQLTRGRPTFKWRASEERSLPLKLTRQTKVHSKKTLHLHNSETDQGGRMVILKCQLVVQFNPLQMLDQQGGQNLTIQESAAGSLSRCSMENQQL